MIIFRSVIIMLILSETAMAQKALYAEPLGIEAYTFRKSFAVDVARTLDTSGCWASLN